MQLFIDSADRKSIEELAGLLIFKGITTTPTFFFRQGIYDYEDEVRKLGRMICGEVHVEAMGCSSDEIICNARKNAEVYTSSVSKIPMSRHAVAAVKKLSSCGIRTNIHLVFSANQAIMAAEAGADYICPLLGRMNDIGMSAFTVLESIINILHKHNYCTKVMASSIRSPDDVQKALELGVDCVTIPPDIIAKMFEHPLTTDGVRLFEQDILMSTRVSKLMKNNGQMPLVNDSNTLHEALEQMTKKRIGIAIVVDECNKLIGVVTDGDIRRKLNSTSNTKDIKVRSCMNLNPKVIRSDTVVHEALRIMQKGRITALIIADDDKTPAGYVDLHDILPQPR